MRGNKATVCKMLSKDDKMRRMWRMRQLLKRIRKLNDPAGFFINYLKKEHDKTQIIDKFLSEGFLSNSLVSLRQAFYRAVVRKEAPTTKWSYSQYLKQKGRIQESVDACLKRNYLAYTRFDHWPDGRGGVIKVPSETHVKITQDGKEFIQWFRFVDAVLSEYGRILSFLFGVIGTGVLGSLVFLWPRLINFLMGLLRG